MKVAEKKWASFIAGVGTAPPRISTSYIAITDNILHRMRFPKFLMVVREELGEEVGILLYSSPYM
jgi:hypothetical protein